MPLILNLIRNFYDNKNLLSGFENYFHEYLEDRPLNYFQLLNSVKKIEKMVENLSSSFLKANMIGFTCYQTNLFASFLCALYLRQKGYNKPIIFGGPQASQSKNTQKLLLKTKAADVIVIGEGEIAWPEIIKTYKKEKKFTIPNTIYFDHEAEMFIENPKIPAILNNLPDPDFSCLELSKYPYKESTLPLYASRGCPHSCAFCNETTMWRPYRQLSPEQVIKRMISLNKKHGAFRFYFTDSLLNGSIKWLNEFCDLLINKSLDFQWYGYFSTNLNFELASKLQKAGLVRAFIGMESVSSKLLKNMQKKKTSSQNISAIKEMLKAKIPLEISHLIGFPGESEKDFKINYKYLLNLKKDYPNQFCLNFEPFQLVPGSKVFESPDNYGILVKGWSAKIINIVPELSEIVQNIPMKIIASPSVDTIRKRQMFLKTFFENKKSEKNIFLSKTMVPLLIKNHKQLEGKNRLKLVDIGQKYFHFKDKDDLLIQIPPNKVIKITTREKWMIDRLAGKTSIDEMILDYSARWKEKENISRNLLSSLLDKLLKNGIWYKIT
ncbi:MAG: radical SAM protein [Pseudomonadota bacterium]